MSKVNWNDIVNVFDRKYYYLNEEGEVVKRSWGERIVRTLHLESFVNNVVARIFPSLRFVNHHSIPNEKFRENIKLAANLETDKSLVARGIAKINELIEHISYVSSEDLFPISLDDKEDESPEEPVVNSREVTPPLSPVVNEEALATTSQEQVLTDAANSTIPADTSAVNAIDWEEEYNLDLLFDQADKANDDATKGEPQLIESLIIDAPTAVAHSVEEVVVVDNQEEPVAQTAQVRDARIAARDAEKATPGTKQRAHVSVVVEDSSGE